MASGGPMWYMDSPLVRAAAVYSSRLLTCAAPVERTSSVLASHLRRGGSARLQKWAWSMGGRKIHAAASGGEDTPFDGLDRGVRVSETRREAAHWKQAQDGQLTFVFLEGATGVGKSTLTYKLEKMGYRVVYEGFVDLCRIYAAKGYSPTSALLTLKWSSKLLEHMEKAQDAHAKGLIKDDLVFFDRSFLTPAIYARGLPVADFMNQVMDEARASYPIVTVMCEADPYATKLRVGGRLFDSKADEKAVRESLGEEDATFQQEIVTRYEEMEKEGHFDLVLNTSSSKLALASLLHALGINFSGFSDDGSKFEGFSKSDNVGLPPSK
eukprot:CAMPEP_0179472012 /NCGR_PEP_ID=MMETSP0799-20121207/52131_1 /TAXON_ID=46947 /ORGANISM="Geminigera cryophila, Strain CCMP2564" /LENGTH=324 /DNA_ID=CAMNT_0021279975 /DNA_START=99 /DNA_END=1073 /DNA_ORIENTATION=+